MIRLAVAGAAGRTGRQVLELALRDPRFEITAALTRADDSACGSALHVGDHDVPLVAALNVPCDVLIDFTVAEGTMSWLKPCADRKLPMVIGATGHDGAQLARIRETAQIIPIVQASNFSVGIRVLADLVGKVAKELGDGYDIEITETHHRGKIDAPSGTALTLLDELLAATGCTRDEHAVFGRRGQTGERPAGQIGIHALRMGEIVGRHEVHFSGPGETITLKHTAHSRAAFAAGALRAAAWVVEQQPGLYALRDVTA